MADEDIMDIAADLAEKGMQEHIKQRQERFAKMGEGKSERYKRRLERMQIARREYDYVKVRVVPKDEETRRNLVHPLNNIAFGEKGSREWPMDSFTERRLLDGDITLEGQAEAAARAAKRSAPVTSRTAPAPPRTTRTAGPPPAPPSRPAE